MQGVFHRLLRINLSEESFREETLSDGLLRRTLGGKGLGTALPCFGKTQPGSGR